jgi:hypothetical protein
MRTIGFSTGALAYSDFHRGLEIARAAGAVAVELSALREPELEPLIAALDDIDLRQFSYVSFHAPSAISSGSERRVVSLLLVAAQREWNVIVHPDVLSHAGEWARLGRWLCIENMDKRKPTGRSSHELQQWFERLPEAGFCLDLGHARQCDTTMTETYFLLKHFRSRLRQVHASEVTTRSNHARISRTCVLSFQQVAKYIPESVPIILESPVSTQDEIADEVARVRAALCSSPSAAPMDRSEGGRPGDSP